MKFKIEIEEIDGKDYFTLHKRTWLIWDKVCICTTPAQCMSIARKIKYMFTGRTVYEVFTL